MKKISAFLALVSFAATMSAQYMIVGKDSISLADFKKDYAYGLENNGVEKTIKTTQDFLLIQQFAYSKKVDTTANFRENMWQNESELRKQFYFPKEVSEPILQDFVNSNKTEKQIQIFMLEKKDGDTKDYQKMYDEVKSGKLSMEDAIYKFTTNGAKPIYIKPGSIDNTLYAEVKNLPNGSYTKLVNNERYVAFAKVLGSRPSLGYMIFGTISYPKDANSETTKTKIYNELKAGKTFEEVAKIYGSNDHEKNNGGVVMGSPTLPDDVYAAFKNQKKGFYSQPIVIDDKYFVFNIYQLLPYTLDDTNRQFFFREMQNTLYAELLQDKLLTYVKASSGYKELPLAQNLKKSFSTLLAHPKDSDVLYQCQNIKTTVGDLKKMTSEHKDEIAKLTPQEWSEVFSDIQNENLLKAYSDDFPNQKEIKKQLLTNKRVLYSDYVFSKYLKEEIEKNPEWVTAHYNKNKSKYFWEKRAKGKVAIIADPKLIDEIKTQMSDAKNWEALKTKYYGKLNPENQVLVHFEEGEMAEDADVFTKYKTPFSKGVHVTKMEKRDLVINIEEILEPSQMTQEESKELIKEALTDEKLNEIIAQQKAKTKIIVQPEFLKDLEKNFKK